MAPSHSSTGQGLTPYLKPAAAWALSIGTSVGWGSLVITSNTYLLQAGPLGSALGLLAGTLIMLLVGRCFFYMMTCTPDAGGAFAYVRDSFGYDHAFLTAWFLALTYLAVLWANASSLPLFARIFMGDIFRFGRLYSVFGYDVYLGEMLLSTSFLLLTGFIVSKHRRSTAAIQTVMAFLFFGAITFCFAAAMLRRDAPVGDVFIPDASALSQVVRIACVTPWAFIGFENISHSAEEFDFPQRKALPVLRISVITTGLLYLFVTLLSVTAYPPAYSSWLEYIKDRSNLSGLAALPAFYAANHYLGSFGVTLLMTALLALIFTSLIGNTLALSRLFYSLARERILPTSLGKLNARSIPANAVWAAVLLSAFIPLIGRTAIGWIVDVTTLGATIIYGFVCACVWKTASFRGDKTDAGLGIAGTVLMIAFLAYLLVPNLFSVGSIETESYFLFVAWSILGFIFFRHVLNRDRDKRFGSSIIVWVALLSLVLFVSLVWMSQTNMAVTARAMDAVQAYYEEAGFSAADDGIVREQLGIIRRSSSRSIVVVVSLFMLSLWVLLTNYATMSRRAKKTEEELGAVRQMANTDPLTGVKSKNAYAAQEQSLNAMLEAGSLRDIAVVVCDVNGLKHVNDTKGHKAGDEYIRAASRLICETYTHSPVFRIGGDEFAVFLQGRDFANRNALLESLDRTVVRNIDEGEVVVSAGMSTCRPGEDRDIRSIFERADSRMYTRKKELKALGANTR